VFNTISELDSFIEELVQAQKSGFLEKILSSVKEKISSVKEKRRTDDKDRVWEMTPEEYVKCTGSKNSYVVMFMPAGAQHKYDIAIVKSLPKLKIYELQEVA
jgi:hypothetical protein